MSGYSYPVCVSLLHEGKNYVFCIPVSYVYVVGFQ